MEEKNYVQEILDLFTEMDEKYNSGILSSVDGDIWQVLGTVIFALQNVKFYEFMQHVNEWRTGVNVYMMRDAAKLLKMEQEEIDE